MSSFASLNSRNNSTVRIRQAKPPALQQQFSDSQSGSRSRSFSAASEDVRHGLKDGVLVSLTTASYGTASHSRRKLVRNS